MSSRRTPTRKAVTRRNTIAIGAKVNIVLKADQPTGRTVSGTVQQILTNGDHPRGVKVRLADGRVGRVQSFCNGGDGIQDEYQSEQSQARGPGRDGSRRGQDLRDGRAGFRMQGEGGGAENPGTQSVGLDAYIRPARRRKGRRLSNDETPVEDLEEEVVACPVCDEFRGDETAVAHHVATHFEN